MPKIISSYNYDEKYVERLMKQALKEYKQGKCIKATSVDEALRKFSDKK